MQSRIWFAFLMVLTAGPTTAVAEKESLSPIELRKIATHVITGTVNAIYTATRTLDDWTYTTYVAEVQVAECAKGEGTKPNDLVYVRYWTRNWIGKGNPPPQTLGHRDLPEEGAFARIYLARNAYDGFGQIDDGGFNVIGANGFENRPLSDANYRAKFRQIQEAHLSRPGQITLADVEVVLRPAEAVTREHVDIAAGPGGAADLDLQWSRWAFANEVLVIGFQDNRIHYIGLLTR